MNAQIRKLGVALLLCFTALFVQLNYIQVLQADRLTDNPNNSREVVAAFSRPRGQILSADGKVLARSVPSNDALKYVRQYPEGPLFGHITGYFNFNFGATGVERRYNEDLAGETPEIKLSQLSDLWDDDERVGDVHLTVRSDVQQAATAALGNQKGAVVAIDPRNGDVLALVSWPSYDPNPLSAHGTSADEAKALLEADPNKPLRGRGWQERYFPGSTFKTVTEGIGFDTGKVTRDQPVYPVQSSFDIDFTDDELDNFGGSSCGGDPFEVLRVSCNSAFAAMGVETIGAPDMVAGAERFGFNRRGPIDLPNAATSVFPTEFPDDQGNGPLARASIGQGDVSASPLQMALVAAAAANVGRVVRPHVVDRITDPEGRTVREPEADVWTTAMSEPAALLLREAMVNVAQNGTARGLQIEGVEVGGKTGTAQLGTDPPSSHAWIIGFAGPPGAARVAVAVIVEAQPGVSEVTGGRVAAPIARAVMEAVLRSPDSAGGG